MMDALIVSSAILLTTQIVGSSSRYLLEQSKLINSRMHSLFGNTTIIKLQTALALPEPPHNRAIPLQLCKVIPPPDIHFGAIPKDKLLEMRPRKTTPPVQAPPVTQTSTRTRAKPRTGRRRTARVQKQKHFLPKSKKQLEKIILPNSQATPQGNSAAPNSRNSNIIQLEANRPAPPPSGAPGAAKAANEECKPQPFARSSLSGRGSRAARRRLYRQWRVALRGNIRIQSLGKTVFSKGPPQKAASFQRAGKNNAKLFRHLVLEQAAHRGPQREKTKKPLATPPLDYGVEVRVGAQNVQGMAELLKHQQCLDMMSKQSLEVLFLTETKSTSYYTYNSQSHLFILNGSPHDKYGGVAAIIAPAFRPFVKDIYQHSSRILHLVIACKSGDCHLIGVYAPHDKLDFETVKEPFWLLLQEVLDQIPQPEPVYVLGDFNVRLQGRKPADQEFLGPHVYGRGSQYAKTGPERNRNLYMNLLQSTESCDAMSFKCPNLLEQVSYRDKAPPPPDWGLFALDSVRLLQFWDVIASLPVSQDESIIIGHNIRTFLTEDPLMQTTPQAPSVDPLRFQALDRLVVRRKWLPTVLSSKINHKQGFPSDHFLLEIKIRVKLGSKPASNPRPPKLDYSSTQQVRESFQNTFRSAYAKSSPAETSARKREYFVYTDGSGSRGRATAHTPAGWGIHMQQGHSVLEGHGRVNTDYSSPYNLGATVGSNNTAELTALMEAALFLLHHTSRTAKVTFYYDSKWAASMMRGQSRPRRHKQMVINARLIYQKLQELAEVEWIWIKGHTGNSGNERADELAEIGKSSQESTGLRYAHTPPVLLVDLSIADSPPSTDDEPRHEKFLKAMKTAEAAHFKPIEYTPRQPWMSQETLRLLQESKHKRATHDSDQHAFYKEVKRRARKEKQDWIRAQFDENYVITPQTWRLAKRMKKGFQERKRRLVVDGKQVPWSKTHQAFANHLAQHQWAPSSVTEEERLLLSQATPLHPPDQREQGVFTMVELQSALNKMKKGKAPGPDGLRPDPVLLLDHYGECRLLDIMNECWISRKIPQSWKDAQVISFYKSKGDDADAANYRPISLLNTQYKLYASLIQARLAENYDDHIRPNQYGFRKHRGTDNPLFTLRRLQDYSLRTGVPFHCLFIDWKQAFDKIDHSSMHIALQRLGIHTHYLEIIKDIYTDPTFHTVGLNGEKAYATPHTGIRQGCPVSPYLFIMVLSVILTDVDDRLISHGVPTNTWSVGKPAYDLEYADDTLLFGITVEVLGEYLKHLQVEASLYGLLLNLEKTELLEHPKYNQEPLTFADGTPVKTNHVVKYLGSQVSWHKPTLTAIQHRMSLASIAFNKLSNLWRSRLSRKAKVRIFIANIVPILTYGLSALTMENKHFQKIDAWFFRFLRRAIGIKHSYYSHITNRSVWEQAYRPLLPSQTVLSSQFRLLLLSLNADPADPFHHVAYGPANKDRVALHKHHKTGPPPPHWIALVHKHAMEYYLPEIQNKDYRKDVIGLQLYINRYSSTFPARLLAAPTRQPSFFSLYSSSIGSAWRP